MECINQTGSLFTLARTYTCLQVRWIRYMCTVRICDICPLVECAPERAYVQQQKHCKINAQGGFNDNSQLQHHPFTLQYQTWICVKTHVRVHIQCMYKCICTHTDNSQNTHTLCNSLVRDTATHVLMKGPLSHLKKRMSFI